MKTTLACVVLAIVVGFVAMAKVSMGGSYSVAVWLPEGTQCTTDTVHQFALKHNWKKEMAAAGVGLPDDHVDALLNEMVVPSPETSDQMLQYVLQYQVSVPLFWGSTRRVNDGADYIQHRLQVEAWCLSYPTLPRAEARRDIAWSIYGSGFDERAAQFLDDAISAEMDEGLRGWLEALRSH